VAGVPDGLAYHDPDRAYEGYTLFSYTYEDPDEPVEIYLVDMDGEPVETWSVETALQSYCRLLPDGDLLYPTRDRSDIGEAGLRRLAPDSSVEWYYHCRTDHDFQVLDDGNLLIHTLDDHMVPGLGNGLKRNPYLVEITPEKELVWEWRGEDHVSEIQDLLSAEEWAFVEDRIDEEYQFDWAHNNTTQVIPENDAYEESGDARVEPGNVVFSYRSLDVIGTIDRPSGEIVWAWGPDELDGQHKPHVLPDGNVLVFDNGTLRGYSRVIELDPLTEEIEWEYTADTREEFHSRYVSSAQRLPNGNTLVCSGNQRWLFEVTRDGDVVWEFEQPFRDENPDGGSIYRCLRYSPEYVEPLLDRI
jgi:hypothetical protein